MKAFETIWGAGQTPEEHPVDHGVLLSEPVEHRREPNPDPPGRLGLPPSGRHTATLMA